MKKTYYLDPHINAANWEEFIGAFEGYANTEIFGKISKIEMKPKLQTVDGEIVVKLELVVSYEPPEYYLGK